MKTYVEEKRIRPDILTALVYWSFIIMMFFGIISVRIFGDKGFGFSSGALALYFVLYVSFVLAVQKSVYIMVRLRARRSQFLNAQINMSRSLKLFMAIGMIVALIMGFSSYAIARFLFGSVRIYILVIIAAVSLVFLAPQGVLRGYLQGLGYTRPIVLSDVLISAVSFGTGAVISGIMYSYGKKVNELFHGDEYSAVYGASGMMIGMLIGSIAGCIQITISMYLRKKEIAEVVKEGAPRYLDNKNDVITGIRSIVYLYASPALMFLVDNVVYILCESRTGDAGDMIISVGAYFGRIIILSVLLALLCCIPFLKSWNRIMARIERDELEGARERFRKNVHFMSMLIIPVTVFFFSMSEHIQVAVFEKSSAYITGMFQMGAVLTVLFAISIFCSWLLNHMGKSLLLVINLTAAWALHVVILVVLEGGMGKGIWGILIAEILAFLLYDILCIFMIYRMLKMRYNLLHNIGLPLISSALCGLVVFLAGRILVNVIGEVLTIVLLVIVYAVIYMVVLILLRGIRTHELESVPLGRFLIPFSSTIQHDRYYEKE